MKQIQLLTTGFIQVFFVALNTIFLSKENYFGVIVASFMISLVWSFNVKKIAFGSRKDQISYATGATIGSVTALFLYKLIEPITK